MARGDVDMGVKDYEGFTAFDVFNSTCEGTNPIDGAAGTDLYTWGSNRESCISILRVIAFGKLVLMRSINPFRKLHARCRRHDRQGSA